jgi:hypothetical protein
LRGAGPKWSRKAPCGAQAVRAKALRAKLRKGKKVNYVLFSVRAAPYPGIAAVCHTVALLES